MGIVRARLRAYWGLATPHWIKGVSNTEERGFIQRLMVYAPKDRLGERVFRTEPVPDKISDAYHWLVVNLVYRLWGVPPGGSLTLTFSPQARELITRWRSLRGIAPEISGTTTSSACCCCAQRSRRSLGPDRYQPTRCPSRRRFPAR
jgi:hypothetical protein